MSRTRIFLHFFAFVASQHLPRSGQKGHWFFFGFEQLRNNQGLNRCRRRKLQLVLQASAYFCQQSHAVPRFRRRRRSICVVVFLILIRVIGAVLGHSKGCARFRYGRLVWGGSGGRIKTGVFQSSVYCGGCKGGMRARCSWWNGRKPQYRSGRTRNGRLPKKCTRSSDPSKHHHQNDRRYSKEVVRSGRLPSLGSSISHEWESVCRLNNRKKLLRWNGKRRKVFSFLKCFCKSLDCSHYRTSVSKVLRVAFDWIRRSCDEKSTKEFDTLEWCLLFSF